MSRAKFLSSPSVPAWHVTGRHLSLYSYIYIYIQSIHKRMVRFQKLTISLFLTLHGRNLIRQQRQLSMRYQQLISHCLLRGRGASFQDGAAAGKRFLCAPF